MRTRQPRATQPLLLTLVEHGLPGFGCWTPSRARRDFERAANHHFSSARRARPAVEQTTVRAIRKESTP